MSYVFHDVHQCRRTPVSGPLTVPGRVVRDPRSMQGSRITGEPRWAFGRRVGSCVGDTVCWAQKIRREVLSGEVYGGMQLVMVTALGRRS